MTKPIPELTAKTKARFWARVDVRGPDNCWLWNRNGNLKEYGVFGIGAAQYFAHRVSMALDGRDPLDLCACHRCDTPLCVNPAHLFAGTRTDNAADMTNKGRRPRGEAMARSKRGELNPSARLTADDVRAIRNDPRELMAVASEYGISFQHVSDIRLRHKWRHVD